MKAGNPDIKKHNKKGNFKVNPQNINKKGAPLKMVSHVLAELKAKGVEPVSKSQIVELFENLLNLDRNNLEIYANDEKQPIINQIVAKAMLNDKGFEIIERMLDRVHGKAIQETKINMNVDIEIEPEKED